MATSALAFADTWNGKNSDTSWYEEGKSEYRLSTAAQLKGLADLVNNKMVTFEGCAVYLDNDIDLNDRQWTPIGFGNSAWKGRFLGDFYGGGHFIENMYIDTSLLPSHSQDVLTTGLFGNAYGKIADIHLTGVIDISSTSNSYYLGGLVAQGNAVERVSCNVSMRFNVGTSGSITVGLVAALAKNISQAKCRGLIYYKDSSSSRGCFGGVAGNVTSISQCLCEANIGLNILNGSGTLSYVGGIAGMAMTVDNCIYTGGLSVYKVFSNLQNIFLGGITTGNMESTNTLNNVIFAPSSFYADIIYYNKSMTTVWAGSVTNAYYNSSYASSTEKYGYGVATDYLKSGSRLEGFDTDVWEFRQGAYPMLKALKIKYTVSVPVVNGRASFYVDEGESATIGLTPESGWLLKAVYVNTVDMTSSVGGGKLTLNDIRQNYMVSAVFEKDAQGIRNVNTGSRPNIRVVEGNRLIFSGISTGSHIRVYDMDGRMVKDMVYSHKSSILLRGGTYIVNVGEASFKVSLK